MDCPCVCVMGAGEEIQEVIKNRLFSQGKKETVSHGAVGTCGTHQSILSTFNTLQSIHHVSRDCQDASMFHFPTFPLLSHSFLFFPRHKFRILWEFSSAMNKSGVFICESFLWSVSWPGVGGGGAGRSVRFSLGFLTAPSKA